MGSDFYVFEVFLTAIIFFILAPIIIIILNDSMVNFLVRRFFNLNVCVLLSSKIKCVAQCLERCQGRENQVVPDNSSLDGARNGDLEEMAIITKY